MRNAEAILHLSGAFRAVLPADSGTPEQDEPHRPQNLAAAGVHLRSGRAVSVRVLAEAAMTRCDSSFVESRRLVLRRDTGMTELSQALARLEWGTIASQNCAVIAQEPLHG